MTAILKNSFLVCFLSLVVVLNQFQDKKACDVFNRNLSIIKERLNKNPSQNLGDVNLAINFLENVTGIISHSDGNYFGRWDPTEDDYSKWLNWFKINNDRLYWDEKEQTVKVRPPG